MEGGKCSGRSLSSKERRATFFSSFFNDVNDDEAGELQPAFYMAWNYRIPYKKYILDNQTDSRSAQTRADQSRLEQTGGTLAVPVWATSDNVVAVADVVVVFGCSCCCSCCFWCCCEFHFGCFIVVAGIILRHLSQSWHDWLEQSRKQTTQLESWTRRLGRLDRLDSLGKWNWTCSPSAARTTGPMNRRYSWRNGCKLYDQHCGYFICWCPVWRQSETLITLFGRTWRANAITAPRYCRSSVNVAVKRFCVVA